MAYLRSLQPKINLKDSSGVEYSGRVVAAADGRGKVSLDSNSPVPSVGTTIVAMGIESQPLPCAGEGEFSAAIKVGRIPDS